MRYALGSNIKRLRNPKKFSDLSFKLPDIENGKEDGGSDRSGSELSQESHLSDYLSENSDHVTNLRMRQQGS